MSLVAAVVITLGNLVLALGGAFVAVQLGFPAGLLAVPVIAVCGFAAVWQVVAVARAKRRRDAA